MNLITKKSVVTVAIASLISSAVAQTYSAPITYSGFNIAADGNSAKVTATWAPTTGYPNGSYSFDIDIALNESSVSSGSNYYFHGTDVNNNKSVGGYTLGIYSDAGTNGDTISVTVSPAAAHVSSTGPSAGYVWDSAPNIAGQFSDYFNRTGARIQLIGGTNRFSGLSNYSADFQFTGTGANATSDWILLPAYRSITGSISASAVPEPSSSALLGLAGIALILRRKK